MCGEQAEIPADHLDALGSSPRVRGTVAGLPELAATARIIPACAGNRFTSPSTARTKADHPRVCGEQTRWPRHPQSIAGSSPRVRGTVPVAPPAGDARRIIPACAGNRGPRRRWSLRSPDHPRVCGEQVTQREDEARHVGSSPRVRGTVHPFMCVWVIRRIIPACAGNRGYRTLAHSDSADHPRVCGEQICATPKK